MINETFYGRVHMVQGKGAEKPSKLRLALEMMEKNRWSPFRN